MNTKKPWRSKTLWANIIAGVALLAQHFTGYELGMEMQAELLVVVNIILRVITNQGLSNS